MGLASVRPFFRTRLLGLGFQEHTDAFDDLNRPQQRLEKLFRIQSNVVTGNDANHSSHRFDFDVDLVITLKGKLDNIALVDRAYVVADEILTDVLDEAVRIGTAIKSIRPGSVTVESYGASDENDVRLIMNFTGYLITQF